MRQEDIYHRQLSIVPMDRLEKAKATLIGCGAVGSFTAFVLAKMGICNIAVYDHDRVEIHNIPNQLFSIQDCGLFKAEALRDMVLNFHGVEVDAFPVKFSDQPLSGIVIVAVDSMDVRLAIWDQVKYRPMIDLFIDSRMGAEVGRVLTIHPTDPDDIAIYENTLHTSQDALPARCTERSIVYTVLGISGAICGKIKKFIAGQPFHKDLVLDFRQSLIFANK